MNFTKAALFAAFSTLACLNPLASDWPQWRGPNRDGISHETGLLKQWPKDGPKLVWQVDNLGSGYSTPAVAGDRLYVLSNDGLENESVKALSVKDGKEVWVQRLGKVGNPNQRPPYPGSRSTPTVEGEAVYALGSDGDLARLDAATGRPNWTKSLRADFGGSPGEWAYSESPLIDGDALVCTPGGDTATIVALNKNSGEVIWKSAIPGEQAAYASIVVLETDGLKQYVQFLQKGLAGVDAKTGKLLWRYDRPAVGSPANIPTPVVDKNYVYSGSGRAGGGLIKLNVTDGNVAVEPVYFEKKMPTAIGGAVKVGPYLYGTSSALVCLDFATGQTKWEERGIGTASLVFAGGHLYLHGENGEVALVEANPEAYREKGRFSPPGMPDHGREKAWAYPVVANGHLYIRDMNMLWAFDIRDRGVAAR